VSIFSKFWKKPSKAVQKVELPSALKRINPLPTLQEIIQPKLYVLDLKSDPGGHLHARCKHHHRLLWQIKYPNYGKELPCGNTEEEIESAKQLLSEKYNSEYVKFTGAKELKWGMTEYGGYRRALELIFDQEENYQKFIDTWSTRPRFQTHTNLEGEYKIAVVHAMYDNGYYLENLERLQAWCDKNKCLLKTIIHTGPTQSSWLAFAVGIPDEKTFTLFTLSWT
jgi:hypothetical protein